MSDDDLSREPIEVPDDADPWGDPPRWYLPAGATITDAPNPDQLSVTAQRFWRLGRVLAAGPRVSWAVFLMGGLWVVAYLSGQGTSKLWVALVWFVLASLLLTGSKVLRRRVRDRRAHRAGYAVPHGMDNVVLAGHLARVELDPVLATRPSLRHPIAEWRLRRSIRNSYVIILEALDGAAVARHRNKHEDWSQFLGAIHTSASALVTIHDSLATMGSESAASPDE